MKKKYDLVIAGTELAIISDEDEKYVKAAAKELDEEIVGTVVNNQRCTKLEAAILCALSHLDAQRKAEEKAEALLKEIEELKNERQL
ncbi:MAG: cell division protein ZapA [Ruminococcaceae bacterium]|nr:cell division protein ZapA [Oscillospiraceae bacterium]